MKKLLLLTGLFLAACAPTTAPEETTPFELTQPPPTVMVETNRSAVAPTSTATAVSTDLAAVATTDSPTPKPATSEPGVAEPAPIVDVQPTPELPALASPIISGRTEEGTYFYGSPDAPVTLIDFSDFL